MWWILTSLFILISLVTSIVCYYSLRRINQYEQFLINIEKIISYSNERVKQIDSKGSFESDDEIGFFFKEVQKLQDMMSDIFENTDTEETTNG
tara:strand:- start:871 stop:1149 length:279 start_codon:yes stop_codon:yes gene_type:complete